MVFVVRLGIAMVVVVVVPPKGHVLLFFVSCTLSFDGLRTG